MAKKSERITALETQVAELQAKVEALEKAGKYPLTAQFERESAVESEAVDGILADIERKAKPTPNEQRADVIKRAKAFVTKYEGILKDAAIIRVEFVVNPDKRTVVAILHGLLTKQVRHRAFAKCDPDDVFNADIGKAIALARALGVEVPEEFVKAVQPTEIVLGHRVYYTDKFPDLRVIKGLSDGREKVLRLELAKVHASSNRIIDDTDAVYE